MYKPLADSTLMAMTKKEIIEHLRCAEYNHKVCEEQIEQQYKNCMRLLKEERADAIDEYKNQLWKDIETRYKNDIKILGYLSAENLLRDVHNAICYFADQLKEKK